MLEDRGRRDALAELRLAEAGSKRRGRGMRRHDAPAAASASVRVRKAQRSYRSAVLRECRWRRGATAVSDAAVPRAPAAGCQNRDVTARAAHTRPLPADRVVRSLAEPARLRCTRSQRPRSSAPGTHAARRSSARQVRSGPPLGSGGSRSPGAILIASRSAVSMFINSRPHQFVPCCLPRCEP